MRQATKNTKPNEIACLLWSILRSCADQFVLKFVLLIMCP